jgi:hypothetical protein
LKDASGSESENDDRTKDEGEQQGNRQREVPMEIMKVTSTFCWFAG